VLEIDLDLGDVILAGSCEARAATRRAPSERTARAEQRGEKVAEAAVVFRAPEARELEASAPIGRRTELLARAPVRAELIVCGSLLGVLQDLVRFLDFLEAFFRIRFFADIRVIL